MGEISLCHCGCHGTSVKVRHIVPCCYRCNTCARNIKSSQHIKHEKECAAEVEEFKKKHGIT